MNADNVELVRKWVCGSRRLRLEGCELRWTRCRYERWRMEIPAECLKEEDSDDDEPSATEVRTLLVCFRHTHTYAHVAVFRSRCEFIRLVF